MLNKYDCISTRQIQTQATNTRYVFIVLKGLLAFNPFNARFTIVPLKP